MQRAAKHRILELREITGTMLRAANPCVATHSYVERAAAMRSFSMNSQPPHSIAISNKKGQRSAHRKWRRQAKERLAGSGKKVKPKRQESPKRKKTIGSDDTALTPKLQQAVEEVNALRR